CEHAFPRRCPKPARCLVIARLQCHEQRRQRVSGSSTTGLHVCCDDATYIYAHGMPLPPQRLPMTPVAASKAAKLLKFMLQNQLLTRETADAVEAELAAQKDEVCILEFLGRNGLAEEEQLAAALAQRLRLSYLNLATQTLDPDTTLLIREELA